MTRSIEVVSDPAVNQKFKTYPKSARAKLTFLRKLILESAQELDEVNSIEETLKWGEPSYLTKHGSTLRMDWKSKKPDQYAMYFKCTSQLVPTIKSLYGDLFEYEKNRAIVFGFEDKIPVEELKSCIRMALRYHKVKHLDRLGE